MLGEPDPNWANAQLRIIGGFLGYSNGAQTSDDPSNPDGNPVRTVLTGDSQNPGDGQAIHVLLLEGADATQIELTISRLSIIGGLADDSTLAPYGNDGAGAHLRPVNQDLVQFRTVQFGNNYARFDANGPVPGEQARGGAVFVVASPAVELRFADCTFISNSAQRGGGVYLNVVNEARLGNCSFRNNGTFIDNLQVPGVEYTMPICEEGGGL